MHITYSSSTDGLAAKQLSGFFVDWPQRPDPETHLTILRGSYAVWLAMDGDQCVGFINALSDGVLCAYVPLLEVLPPYQGRGIGTELVRRMMRRLAGMYALDVVCDASLAPFYARLGFAQCTAMVQRNRDHQGTMRML